MPSGPQCLMYACIILTLLHLSEWLWISYAPGWMKIWSRHKGCSCRVLCRCTQHSWAELDISQFNHPKEQMTQGWSGCNLWMISHNAKNKCCRLSAEAVKPFHRVKLNQKTTRNCISKSRRLARSRLSLQNSFSGSNVASQGISQHPDGTLEIESS